MTSNRQILAIFLGVVMFVGSIPLGFSEPLKVQLEQGNTQDQLQCDNPNHVLVLRTNGNYACVTEKSAERLGWVKITRSVIIDVLDIENVQLSFADVFIKSPVKEADIELGLYSKSLEGKTIRAPYTGPLDEYYVIIDSKSLSPTVTHEATMRTADMDEENPQLYADQVALKIQKYLKYFPDYVPDGLELKLITSISGDAMELIYAPINIEIDPTTDNEFDVFDYGGIIFSIVDNIGKYGYDPIESRERFISMADVTGLYDLDGNALVEFEREIVSIEPYDALVLMQDGQFGGTAILHDRIGIGAKSVSFDSDETYKMLQKALEGDLP